MDLTPGAKPEMLEVETAVLKLLPPSFLRQNRVLPLRMNRQKLVVAMANAADWTLLENIRAVSGLEVEPVASSDSVISRSLQRYLGGSGEPPILRDLMLDENQLSNANAQGPRGIESQIVRVVNRLVELALEKRSSDIHLEPQRKGVYARLRIDGVLNTIHQFPNSALPPLVSRIKIMAGLDIAERRMPQDGQFTLMIGTQNVGVRVSVMPGNYGEKVVMRLLNRSTLEIDVQSLQLPEKMKEALISIIERPHGLILVTGPTGTGKTTTLYAMLKHILSNYKNIVTLEDPIEYELLAYTASDMGITQIQVNPKVGMTFATSLRSVLRQDPDIIMVGEIRDKETAEITMRAVMTGHLVLSSLHTGDAPSALNRLVDMGLERYLISSSVSLVMAQNLVRALCLKCRQRYEPHVDFLKKIFPPDYNFTTATFYRSVGCAQCFDTGFYGRRPIFELLAVDNDIRSQMQADASVDALRRLIRTKKGIPSLRDFGLGLVVAGITTLEEVLRTTVDERAEFQF